MELDAIGEEFSDYHIKMNFIMAIRPAFSDVVGKIEKKDVQKISFNEMKGMLRDHVKEIAESENRVGNMYGDLICWRTKKQKHVALSSAEAEFIGMSLACKEVISLNI